MEKRRPLSLPAENLNLHGQLYRAALMEAAEARSSVPDPVPSFSLGSFSISVVFQVVPGCYKERGICPPAAQILA